ncbi:hypothetical protein IMX26_11930 [Clostridium sp. 'deep sea']|uniref:acyl-[acyl-carrier-protein] thioesterase n=1 Tax=Clostridium sp. 'deep sea' TaxID=2779445 RepID=UPI0018968647|nr:acyl-ACP thioesterase domain-containing protein [Clostridium sp. 'deep sea']QOR34197.1 hypothetical protein IMX26_11930 [Clostridium sp. 'deep sea']
MNYIWKESWQVRTPEVDFKARIKPAEIFKLMQEAAEHSADSLGVGLRYITENKVFWVLSRVNIRFFELPKQNDIITIETWPKGCNRLFALRDFKIYNNDNLCAIATTSWLLLDAKTRKMTRLANFPGNNNVFAIEENAPKLRTKLSFNDCYAKKIQVCDLDVNNHVNNARYIEWVMNTFNYDTYKSIKINEIAINFISEMKYGDSTILRKTNVNNNEVYVAAINEHTDKQSTLTRIRFTHI